MPRLIEAVIIIAFSANLFHSVARAQIDTIWHRVYNGPADGADVPVSMDIDIFGNVYATGMSEGNNNTGYDFATVKYFPNGDTAWVRRLTNNDGPYPDETSMVLADNQGNVYVAGVYCEIRSNRGYCLIKYGPDGDTAWVRFYGVVSQGMFGPGPYIALGSSGCIYLAGYRVRYDYNIYNDLLIIKYRPNGDTAWTRIYDTPLECNKRAQCIAIDDYENIYAAGFIDDPLASNCDFLTVSYDSSGNQRWADVLDLSDDELDVARYIAVDGSGNVYIAGERNAAYVQSDIFMVKYSPSGDTLWSKRYNGTDSNSDYVRGLAIDNSGNIILTGYVREANGHNIITLKYGPDGDEIWRRYYGNGSIVNCLRLDNLGNIYLGGGLVDSGPFLMKYYPSGDVAWTWSYPSVVRHDANFIYIDSSTIYLLAGSSAVGYADYNTFKLRETNIGIDNPIGQIPHYSKLSQNYPNPFNPTTTIQYDLPRSLEVSIDIFDILGRRIETLVNAKQQVGHHTAIWDGKNNSSGIYFYKIKAGDFTATRKMLLLR